MIEYVNLFLLLTMFGSYKSYKSYKYINGFRNTRSVN